MNRENILDYIKQHNLCSVCGFDVKDHPGRHMKQYHGEQKYKRLALNDPWPLSEEAFCNNLEEVMLNDAKPASSMVKRGPKKGFRDILQEDNSSASQRQLGKRTRAIMEDSCIQTDLTIN